MMNNLPARRQSANVSPAESPPDPPADAPKDRRSKPSPAFGGESGSQKLKRVLPWVLLVMGVAVLVNWNASRMRAQTAGLGGAKMQTMTAVAQQGGSQCVSAIKSDTPTAQCQGFCNAKFKKFHCAWCKCRACDFCPKGGEAIEEAAKAAPPPFSPPPSPAMPPLASTEPSISSTDTSLAANSSVSVAVPPSSDSSNASSTVEAGTAAADIIMPATTNNGEVTANVTAVGVEVGAVDAPQPNLTTMDVQAVAAPPVDPNVTAVSAPTAGTAQDKVSQVDQKGSTEGQALPSAEEAEAKEDDDEDDDEDDEDDEDDGASDGAADAESEAEAPKDAQAVSPEEQAEAEPVEAASPDATSPQETSSQEKQEELVGADAEPQ